MAMQEKSHQMKIYEKDRIERECKWMGEWEWNWMNEWQKGEKEVAYKRAVERAYEENGWKPKKGRLLNLNHNLFVLEIGRNAEMEMQTQRQWQ